MQIFFYYVLDSLIEYYIVFTSYINADNIDGNYIVGSEKIRSL